MERPFIVMAGATGNLGKRIAAELRDRDARVCALVRSNGSPDDVGKLRDLGVEIAEIDFDIESGLVEACRGASCVVSVLAGLREVIVETQTRLLDAAVKAGVPRFIPSDFSIDFTDLEPGSNRNLDLRREFMERLDKTPIKATTIFNGAFTDMLTGQAPIVLFRVKRILYWGDANQRLDFTSIDDVAAFTASAAVDDSSPRFLRIAGDEVSARELAAAAGRASGQRFRTFRAGGLWLLGLIIKVVRSLFPSKGELYPPWQGMQYLHNMFSGRGRIKPLDNDRYGKREWTTVDDVLSRFLQEAAK